MLGAAVALLGPTLLVGWLVAIGVVNWVVQPASNTIFVDRAFVAISAVTAFTALQCSSLLDSVWASQATWVLHALLAHAVTAAYVLVLAAPGAATSSSRTVDAITTALLYVALLLILFMGVRMRQSGARIRKMMDDDPRQN